MKKIIILALLLPIKCLASTNDYFLTSICEVQKTVYVPIDNNDKNPEATFEVDEKSTGETYSLAIYKDGTINVEYKSKEHPVINWNLIEELKRPATEFKIIDIFKYKLVFMLNYTNIQQRTFYFDLDKIGNGFLAIVDTRWNTIAKHQGLIFCTCKNRRSK